MTYDTIVDLRRSVYQTKNTIPITEEELIRVIEHTFTKTPSSFHAQGQRIALLLESEHLRFWDKTKEELRKIVPAENFGKTEAKINGLKNSYGTLLFYHDGQTIANLKQKNPLYEAKIHDWALEENGMLQINLWNHLATLGIGASLQHYNELVEIFLQEDFGVSKDWILFGQMPFGEIAQEPAEKQRMDVSQRIVIKK